SGITKLRSEYPCPCACETRFTGTPSTKIAKSVPWSESKPRMRYCAAFAPPWCCATTSPGTSFSTWVIVSCGRSSKSRARMSSDDAADSGRFASPTISESAARSPRLQSVKPPDAFPYSAESWADAAVASHAATTTARPSRVVLNGAGLLLGPIMRARPDRPIVLTYEPGERSDRCRRRGASARGSLAPEHAVGGRDDEEVQERRRREPADDHERERLLDLAAGPSAEREKRQEREAGDQGGHEDRSEAVGGRRDDLCAIERPPARLRLLLEMRDQHDAVSDRDAEHRDEADDRAERQPAARAERDRDDPADERERRVHEREEAQRQRPEVGKEQDQDPDEAERADADELPLRRARRRVLAADLAVHARRQSRRRKDALR